jgi:integrase
MVEAFKTDGIELVNPFVGQRLRRIEIKPYTPLPPERLDMIWRDAVKLRDGDPDAPIPAKPSRQKRRKRRKRGEVLPALKKRKRWTTPNWQKPRPRCYTILLLELGVGLRREEADKAEWDWFFTSRNGRRYLEVKKTEYFTPKGKRRRILPVEQVLWDAIHETRTDLTPFIVPGKTPNIYTPETEPKEIVYRCEADHRALAAWLRMKGVDDEKPCHLLRKEFGSYVATSFGLFAAQRLLGHSSPSVTEAYYAGLTELPELRHA